MIANFDEKEMGGCETSYSIMAIIHIVISSIFLINFLVAIISNVYETMIFNGDFYSI
jgi:hypothetical protein